MKISELISLLYQHKDEQGDIDVIAQGEHQGLFGYLAIGWEYSVPGLEYGEGTFDLISEEDLYDYPEAEKRLIIGA